MFKRRGKKGNIVELKESTTESINDCTSLCLCDVRMSDGSYISPLSSRTRVDSNGVEMIMLKALVTEEMAPPFGNLLIQIPKEKIRSDFTRPFLDDKGNIVPHINEYFISKSVSEVKCYIKKEDGIEPMPFTMQDSYNSPLK